MLRNSWNCNIGAALISQCNGSPTGFGAGFKGHLLAVCGGHRYQAQPR